MIKFPPVNSFIIVCSRCRTAPDKKEISLQIFVVATAKWFNFDSDRTSQPTQQSDIFIACIDTFVLSPEALSLQLKWELSKIPFSFRLRLALSFFFCCCRNCHQSQWMRAKAMWTGSEMTQIDWNINFPSIHQQNNTSTKTDESAQISPPLHNRNLENEGEKHVMRHCYKWQSSFLPPPIRKRHRFTRTHKVSLLLSSFRQI